MFKNINKYFFDGGFYTKQANKNSAVTSTITQINLGTVFVSVLLLSRNTSALKKVLKKHLSEFCYIMLITTYYDK